MTARPTPLTVSSWAFARLTAAGRPAASLAQVVDEPTAPHGDGYGPRTVSFTAPCPAGHVALWRSERLWDSRDRSSFVCPVCAPHVPSQPSPQEVSR